MTGNSNETQWYIARDGKQHGPLTDIEMRTFVAHSYLRATDLIWRPGMPEWQPAPAVFPAVFQPTHPAPAPAAPQPAATGAGAAQKAASAPGAPQASAPGSTSAANTPDAARTDFDEDADAPRAERSMAKRLVMATAALTVIGGGAFALATYREPLMRMVSSAPEKPAAKTAVVTAPPVAKVAPPAATPPAPPPAAPAQPAPTADAPAQPAAPATATAAPPAAATGEQQPAAAAPAPAAPAAETKVAAVAPPAAAPPAPPAAPSIAGSAIDAKLQKVPVWAAIKKDYPDWYVGHIAAADKLAADKKPESEIAMHLAQGLVSLRRQNADKALAASPEKLRKIATAFLDHLKSLRAQGVTACYGFISKGETSPAVVQAMENPETATALNAQAGAIFDAIQEGGKAPVKHAPAVKTDYDILIKELGKLGWKEEDLQVFSNPKLLAKREPEQVCKMVQEWFVAHLAVPDKAARDRLLYETLKPVVSG